MGLLLMAALGLQLGYTGELPGDLSGTLVLGLKPRDPSLIGLSCGISIEIPSSSLAHPCTAGWGSTALLIMTAVLVWKTRCCLGCLIVCVKLTGKLLVLLDMSVRVFLEEIRTKQHRWTSSDPLTA